MSLANRVLNLIAKTEYKKVSPGFSSYQPKGGPDPAGCWDTGRKGMMSLLPTGQSGADT